MQPVGKTDGNMAETGVRYSNAELLRMTHDQAAKVLSEDMKKFRLMLLFDAGRLNVPPTKTMNLYGRTYRG